MSVSGVKMSVMGLGVYGWFAMMPSSVMVYSEKYVER